MTTAAGSLLLFDFDGVLADSLTLYSEAVKLILEKIGTPIVRNRDDYLELFEGNFYESMAIRGVDLSAFSSVAKEILPGLDYGAMRPFPGLIPVLSSLQEDHLLAVVSSNSSQVIAKALSGFGFSPYFRDIFGSDFLFSKREKISHALSKYGVTPNRAYYIGDTTGDIAEAKAAGVVSVAAGWGWHSREKLAAAAPDILVDT
ncbi:MAG: HAD family hydrolase, partial [Syntrophales bacterium]